MTVTSYTDGFDVANQAPGTVGPFLLCGGSYQVSCVFGASATISLNRLGPDGSTQLSVFALVSTQPVVVIGLGPGLYQVVIGVATSSISVVKIKS